MFGLQFPSCTVDATKCIRSGTYPTLKGHASGAPWPATFINRASWSDGSIKHISVLPGPFPEAVTTGGIVADVYSNGSAPAASGISLSQLYSESCKVDANGYAGALGTGLGLQGNWAALLANDANNIEVVDYGDGGGGHVWRILTNVESGGTAHGQMEVYWYIQGLVNASGGLAGWRLLPDLTQPWYNVDSPTKNWRGLQTFDINCNGTVLTPPYPYTTASLPAANWIPNGPWNNQFTPTSAPNWLTCGASSCNVTGYFTTTGTLPTGLSANTIYCGQQYQFASYVNFTNCDNGALQITDGGTGTHTFHPTPLLPHFGHLLGAQANGRYQYIQGAGSVASDAPIRITFDNVARVHTRVFPPFDMTLSPIPNDNPSTYGTGANPDFDIMNTGPLSQDVYATGPRDDIGILTAWQARHLYNQSLISEKYVRNIGLISGLFASNMRDGTLHSLVNFSQPTSSYTGMGSSQVTTIQWIGSNNGVTYSSGFTPPIHGAPQIFFNGNNFSHYPEMAGYAYLVTGEPQYLDLEFQQGEQTIFGVPLSSVNNRNVTLGGTTYYGLTTTDSGWGFRQPAWAIRDMSYASALAPDTSPEGVNYKQYFTDIRNANTASPPILLAQQNAYTQSIGLWVPGYPGNYNFRQEYMMNYLNLGLVQATAMAEDSNALAVLQNINVLYYNHLYAISNNSAFPLVSYANAAFTTGGPFSGPFFGCSFTWASTGGGTATITYSPSEANFVPNMSVAVGSVGAYSGTWPVTSVDATHLSFSLPLGSDPGPASGTCSPVGSLITSDAQLVLSYTMDAAPYGGMTISYMAGTPGTLSRSYWDWSGFETKPGGAEWHPVDGDEFIIPPYNAAGLNQAPPAGLSYATPYYTVNTKFGDLSNLTWSGGNIHATTSSPHGLSGTFQGSINGTNPAGYEGSFSCTVTGASTFDCAEATALASPATYTGTFNTFNIAATKGGSPLNLTDTATIYNYFNRFDIPASPPPNWIGTNYVYGNNTGGPLAVGGFKAMQAVGVTGQNYLSDAIARQTAVQNYFGYSTPGFFFQTNPEWAMGSAFP